jgi:hypothetical protein
MPRKVEATPMDCEGMTTPGAIVTVSINSVPGRVIYLNVAKMALTQGNVPINDPEPYATYW